MISKLFRPRYKIRQNMHTWYFWIYTRKWYSPFWTPVAGYQKLEFACAVAIRKGWELG